MKKKVRLIASDLDGTLLDEQKQVSARNQAALQKAAEQGILFVPATGRDPGSGGRACVCPLHDYGERQRRI